MYSDISMRIIAFSSSKRHSANAFASSVLPTPVGPRNKKLPMGCSGSASPARLRRIAPATAETASSCPITRSCKRSSRSISFSISPCIIFVIGIPVHEETTSAISSSVTSSFRMVPSAWRASSAAVAAFSCSCSSGMRPKRSSEARARSPSRVARSSSSCAASISAFKFWTETMESFSFFHSALRLSSDS